MENNYDALWESMQHAGPDEDDEKQPINELDMERDDPDEARLEDEGEQKRIAAAEEAGRVEQAEHEAGNIRTTTLEAAIDSFTDGRTQQFVDMANEYGAAKFFRDMAEKLIGHADAKGEDVSLLGAMLNVYRDIYDEAAPTDSSGGVGEQDEFDESTRKGRAQRRSEDMEESKVDEGTLTSSDFNKLAKMIKGSDTVKTLGGKIRSWLKSTNPKFDQARFGEAAGLLESKVDEAYDNLEVGNTPADDEVTALFDKLETLRAAGKDKEHGGEFDQVLKDLRQKTYARAAQLGIVGKRLGESRLHDSNTKAVNERDMTPEELEQARSTITKELHKEMDAIDGDEPQYASEKPRRAPTTTVLSNEHHELLIRDAGKLYPVGLVTDNEIEGNAFLEANAGMGYIDSDNHGLNYLAAIKAVSESTVNERYSSKDYRMVAGVINNIALGGKAKRLLIQKFSAIFQSDNPAFDYERFHNTAAGV